MSFVDDGTVPERVLAVSAHPDDLEFGCAGTIAKWVAGGAEVTYVIATSGERGSQDANDDPDEFGALRRAEAEAAAARVGVTDVVWLGLEDGTLEHGQDLLEAISRQFRRVRPEVVVTMIPELLPPGGMFINHSDHRAMSMATLDTCLAAGTTGGWFRHLALEEGLAPWKGLVEVRLFGPGVDEHFEDVTDHLEDKLEALGCHASQVDETTLDRIRAWLVANGEKAGVGAAEGQRIIRMRR